MIKIKDKDYKLSLCMIAKDETEGLDRALNSINKYVDEIVVGWNGANPETEKVLQKYNCIIHKHQWPNDFSEARNFTYSKATGDLILWVDADDEVKNPERIAKICQDAFSNDLVGAVWFRYHYDHDANGNCLMVLWRERITRRGWFNWKGRLHETQIQKVDCQHILSDDVYIKHWATTEQINQSAVRNLQIIADQYNKEHKEKKVDAKTVFDLARSLNAVGQKQEALEIFEEYIPLSGWDDDRYIAYLRIAELHRHFKRFNQALNADLLALKLKPLLPDAYHGLADTYFCLEKWDECIHYIKQGMQCKPPLGIMPCDPMFYEAKPLLKLQYALFQQGRADEAIFFAQKALKYYPDNKWLKECLEGYGKFKKEREIETAILTHTKDLKDKDDKNKLKHLVQAIPDYLSDHPIFVRLKNEFNPIIGKNRIAIFCGPSYEMWSPLSVKTGIGGSEEAVINIAQCFNKMGYTVDVFNSVEQPGNYDGVYYHNYWEYDINQPCDIFIVWRVVDYVPLAPKDAKVFLWLHDIQKYEYYNPTNLNRIDKILALSNYHRDNLMEIPDDKFYITRNGIDVSQFNSNGVAKDPYRCIFLSSPDRGLLTLLSMWPEIKKAVPEANLHIYYGFTKTYDNLHADDYNMQIYKEECMRLVKQPGIVYHGQVGHEELANEIKKSAIWCYPTEFSEISCISAIKCQIAQTLPIITDIAALKETVKYGIKLPYQDIYKNEGAQKQFIDFAVFYLSNHKHREAVMIDAPGWVKENYSWQSIAQDWAENLFNK